MRTLFVAVPGAILLSAAAYGQAASAKPNLLGTWENSSHCRVFPNSVTIKSATDEKAEVESVNQGGYRRVWTEKQTNVVGPMTGPDLINFAAASFQYIDGKLKYVQVGPDGLDACVFTKAK